MKFFIDNRISKKIIITILIVMSFNFIVPTTSRADVGGELFKPISQFLTGLADAFIMGLQAIFVGDGDIKYGGIDEINSDAYHIKYSPGIIFSGGVPGLDVNFINPNFQGEEKFEVQRFSGEWKQLGNFSGIADEGLAQYGLTVNEEGVCENKYLKLEETSTNIDWYKNTFGIEPRKHIIFSWKEPVENEEGEVTEFIEYKLISTTIDNTQNFNNIFDGVNLILGNNPNTALRLIQTAIFDIDNIFGQGWTLYKFDPSVTSTGKVIESSAKTLQPTVATWYKALRAIALVGLLSVLVYVGIRVLISSTSQEKAKYKKMIGDWLMAICILFVLQYIMVFTLEITQKITDVLKTNVIRQDGADILMTDLRYELGNPEIADFSEIFPQLLMYLTLVIFTVTFTVQYLKRLLYMAFFTMIAPLIALTYPIDKIKDGKAQAFTTWIREYIFNALLQPMHLLLYYIFVSSAKNLVEANPLYAVVAIGFLVPAEKFFRKMFGFDKAESASPLKAAAGGALIMNAINKMGQKSGKHAAGGSSGGTASGSSAGVRTSSSNAGNIGTGGDSSGSGGTAGSLGTERNASQFGPTMKRAISAPKGSGMAAIGRRVFSAKSGRKIRNMARRGVLGAAGAAALGTVGLAAGIATGDASNAFSYGLAGLGAGYAGANALGDSVLAGEKSLRETFKEGAIGQNEYNNLKADKAFYESDEFMGMVNNPELLSGTTGLGRTAAMRNAVQTYRDNGITDTGKIATAMKAGLSPSEGAYAIKLAQMIGQSGWNNPSTRKDFEARYKSKIPGTNGDKIWKSIEDLL